MKKIFGVAAALLLSTAIAAGSLWAQEFKLDGYLNSGLGVAADNGDTDVYLKAFGVDGESNGYRFRLNGSYTSESKNIGIRLRLQSQRNLTASGYLSIPFAYGWVSFFNNAINVTGGIVDDVTWTTADWWWNDDQGEGLGLLLKSDPVKGLNLGIGAYTISQQTGGNNNILSIGGTLPNFQNVITKFKDTKYTFNAAYTLTDVFRLAASYRTKNRTAWTTGYTFEDNYAYGGWNEPSQFIGEFRLLAVKDLTLVAVGILDNLEDFGNKGNTVISETFAYKLNDLNLGLNAAQFLYKRDDVEADPALLFNLWGSYAINKVVPRLDLVYFKGGQSKTVTAVKQWERRGFAAQGGQPGAITANYGRKGTDDDYSVFSARPSVRINLDNRTFLEIGDMMNYDFGNYEGAYKTNDDSGKKSRFTNVFYVDVKWSF